MTTSTTTNAKNTGLCAEGTPRNRMVEFRVWMIRTPITVPAMLNLPPCSDVPPSTTARMAYSSMKSPAALASAALMFEL